VSLVLGLGASQNCEARNAFIVASRRLSCSRDLGNRNVDRDRCVHHHRVDLSADRCTLGVRRHTEPSYAATNQALVSRLRVASVDAVRARSRLGSCGLGLWDGTVPGRSLAVGGPI